MHYHLLSICVFRLFLQEIPNDLCKAYPVKIRTRLEDRELQHFTKLDAKNINWQSAKPWTVRNGDLPVQEVPVPPPPRKKRKLN